MGLPLSPRRLQWAPRHTGRSGLLALFLAALFLGRWPLSSWGRGWFVLRHLGAPRPSTVATDGRRLLRRHWASCPFTVTATAAAGSDRQGPERPSSRLTPGLLLLLACLLFLIPLAIGLIALKLKICRPYGGAGSPEGGPGLVAALSAAPAGQHPIAPHDPGH